MGGVSHNKWKCRGMDLSNEKDFKNKQSLIIFARDVGSVNPNHMLVSHEFFEELLKNIAELIK